MVNIREVIAKRKRKKGIKKAVKTGQELRASGQTIVSTTSGGRRTQVSGGIFDVIKQQEQGIIDRVTGKSSGGGGSSSSSTASAQAEAQRIASERKIALKKAQAIQRQRELARQRKEQLAREKERERKLRRMSARQKQQFFRQQSNIIKGQALLKLQEQGKKLSPQAQRVAEKEFQRQAQFRRQDLQQFITERQTGSIKGTPTNEIIVVDRNGKYIRDASANERRKFIKQQGSVRASRPVFDSISEEKIYDIEAERERLRQKKTRRGGTLSVKEEAKLDALTAASSVLGFFVGVKQLPSTLVSIAKDPTQLKAIPGHLKKEGVEFGKLLRVSPSEAVIKIGTEIFLMKGTGKALKITGKLGTRATTRLSPKFRGIKDRMIKIPSTTKGKTITIKLGGSVKKISEPLSKQLGLEGKSVTAVSAQADRLVNVIKKQKIIRKPLPKEAKLKPRTKRLLDKFDKQKISVNELRVLMKNVKKETGDSLLERSFFADPRGRFRPSRLGRDPKDASLLDILAGDVTFKTQKPQILIFEKVSVQKFPKTKIFQSIRKKLKSKNPTFTEKETNTLLKFQLKKSGKFKPIGALSKEPEITLAPGEIVKKVKKVGVTLINGKKVSIVHAKVVKASKQTKKLLKKSDKGKLTSKELKTLKKNLKKESGFSPKTSLSRTALSRPRVSLKRTGLSSSLSLSKRKSLKRRKIKSRRIKAISRGQRTTRGRRKATPRQLKNLANARRILARKRIERVGRGFKRPPLIRKTPPVPSKIPFKSKIDKTSKKKITKPLPVFNVYGKSGKKFVKLNGKPLARNDALSKGTYAIDNTTSRQFKIVPAGKSKSIGALKKNERNYFNRAGYKLREFKVKKGRKFALQQRYIERTKRAIDTRGEKKGLTIAKYLKQQKVGKTKRNITPAQRKVLIQRLKKARKVLKQKRK